MQLKTHLCAASVAIVVAVAFAGCVEAQGHHTGHSYYTNTSGHHVHRPVHASRAPRGASAQCTDGSYGFSEHRRGTCSLHGGVMSWR